MTVTHLSMVGDNVVNYVKYLNKNVSTYYNAYHEF